MLKPFNDVGKGLFSAFYQNGLGTLKRTLYGMATADLAMGRESDLIHQPHSAPPSKSLPHKPIAAVGATMRLRWGEFRAGKEL